MGSLAKILKETMADYAQEAVNGYTYLTSNEDDTFFSVIAVADIKGKKHVFMSLVAHINSGVITIEHDANNKPLVDALVQNGVPREKIILTYIGESLETSM